MKFIVHKLKVGDLVRAVVVEHVSNDELIVSFHGDLVRVKNQSLMELKAADKVLVRVTGVNPLAFQIVFDEDRRRGATRINVLA